MQATVTLGDMTMVIEPQGNDEHYIICKEEHTTLAQTVVVENEHKACLVLMALLQPEEPGELFMEFFPDFC